MMNTQGQKENMLGEHRASRLGVQCLGIAYFQFGKGAGVGELARKKSGGVQEKEFLAEDTN